MLNVPGRKNKSYFNGSRSVLEKCASISKIIVCKYPCANAVFFVCVVELFRTPSVDEDRRGMSRPVLFCEKMNIVKTGSTQKNTATAL